MVWIWLLSITVVFIGGPLEHFSSWKRIFRYNPGRSGIWNPWSLEKVLALQCCSGSWRLVVFQVDTNVSKKHTYCLHLQGFRVSPPWERHICSRLKEDSAPWCYLGYFPLSLTKLALWLVLISRWQPYGACSVVEVDRRFRGAYFHLSDDGGSTHLRNSVYFFESRRRAMSQIAVITVTAVRIWNITYFQLIIFLDFLEKGSRMSQYSYMSMPWAMFEPAIPVFELSKTVSCALSAYTTFVCFWGFVIFIYLLIVLSATLS
jgi:hypothetical protein